MILDKNLQFLKRFVNKKQVIELINTSGGGGVDSVFGRVGAVSAQSGDYTASQITNAEDIVNKATDFTTIDNAKYPSIQAVKTYTDALIVGVNKFVDSPSYDASSNLFPSIGGTGLAGAILKGNTWIVQTGTTGNLGGQIVNSGDLIIALVNNPAQVISNWTIAENNLGYTAENITNKATNFSTVNDILYPTVKAVDDQLDLKLNKNAEIVASTKTKITYDVNGLIVSGSDSTTADIADSANKRYVSDAQLIVLSNTSGINTGDREILIQSETVTVNTTQLVFTVPAGFRKLIMFGFTRSSRVDNLGAFLMRFNGDGGANYTDQTSRAINAAFSGGVNISNTGIIFADCPAANKVSTIVGSFKLSIPNPSAPYGKSLTSEFTSVHNNATDCITGQWAGRWNSTAAITTIRITELYGAQLAPGTIIHLYGKY